MNCPSCGHRTDILANYCAHCGTNLNSIYGRADERKSIGDYLPLDIIASVIAACAVPALTLKAAVKATGLSGAAALTSGLSRLGGGIVGGITVLGICGAAAFLLMMIAINVLLSKSIDRAHKNGETKRMLNAKACGCAVSKIIRRRLVERIRKY